MPAFDCIGRALILTTFSVEPIAAHPLAEIRTSSTAMLWASWLSVVPFASAAFACNMFSQRWGFSTPPELQPGGWLAVDVWSPPVIAAIYGALTHAHADFVAPYYVARSALAQVGLTGAAGAMPLVWKPMARDDARAVCAIVIAALYYARAVYNHGGVVARHFRRAGASKKKIVATPSGRRKGAGPSWLCDARHWLTDAHVHSRHVALAQEDQGEDAVDAPVITYTASSRLGPRGINSQAFMFRFLRTAAPRPATCPP